MGVTQLCEVLKNNDALRTLILGTNSIGDEGAELLSKHMASASCCDPQNPLVPTPAEPLAAQCGNAGSASLPHCVLHLKCIM